MNEEREREVTRLLPARRGHFCLESGHHGELWLDLELLCYRTRPILGLADELARRLSLYGIDAVCGPLVEGAFVACMVASAMDVPFTYTERRVEPGAEGLFPVTYTVPPALRSRLEGRRVAIVNDVINAGSAVRGTLADLKACGAQTAAIAALAVLGPSAALLTRNAGLPLETLLALPNEIWEPAACPLCARHVPLDPTGA